MKKPLLILAVLLAVPFAGRAQTGAAQGTRNKMDVRLMHIADGGHDLPRPPFAGRPVVNDGRAQVVIRTDRPRELAASLAAQGFEAQSFGSGAVSARIPVDALGQVAARKDVRLMRAPRRMQLEMDSTRSFTGANAVHDGTGLETPYTGKGVLVGIIDSGIDPGHLAFRDENGNTRVKMYWNHQLDGSAPSSKIPAPGSGDGDTSNGGHGTHVANIAAGSYRGNGFYGMAPGADLYLASTTLEEENIYDCMDAIAKYADSLQMPYVVNMSFGSNLGPHDGTSALSLALDQFVQPGGFICGSMGNSRGEVAHATATLSTAGEVKNLLFQEGTDKLVYAAIYCNNADSTLHLDFKPFFYGTPRTGKAPEKKYFGNGLWESRQFGEAVVYIDPANKKQTYEFYVYADEMRSALADAYKSLGYTYNDAKFGVEVTARTTGTGFHAWTENSYGTFTYPSLNTTDIYVKGDDAYDVSEGPGTTAKAVTVAAWTGASTFKSITGGTYSFQSNAIGDIANFSSRGPWLGTSPKPTVAAPGVAVKSAFYGTTYSDQTMVVDHVVYQLPNYILKSHFYFGVMSGTSMATPVVTGAIALWLEAFPTMSYEQLMDVLQTSSKHDAFTGQGWNADFGYGKLDAYAGLKRTLELARQSGINEVQNTDTPLSLFKGDNAWRLLFNNDESYADIALYAIGGQRVFGKRAEGIRRGNEEVVSFAGLAPGVYVLRVHTAKASYTRKVMVK